MERQQLKNWTLVYEGNTLKGNVPGDVLIDLHNAGLIDDPYYSDNVKRLKGYLDKEAEYITEFVVDGDYPCAKIVFEGVDTYADVYLNGVLLGRTENMFLRYDFDISKLLKQGKNELRVKLLPLKSILKEGFFGGAVFNRDRMQLRKTQCHFGWDWAPDLAGYGIWLPVRLELSDGYSIDDVACYPTLDGQVKMLVKSSGGGVLNVAVDGQNYGDFNLHDGENELSFAVENPELWYPNGYGEQRLYTYALTLKKDGVEKDTARGRFAFRESKVVEEKTADGRLSFGLAINGKRVFSKGSNWVPCSNQTGAIADEEYETLLRYAKDANYTMLRVWGGGNYEKELFYDLCDELGILIWQDIMFACQEVPINCNIVERVSPELEYQLTRLRKHPCVALICGGNEWSCENPENNEPVTSLMKEFSERLVPELRYVPCSPFGYEKGNELASVSSGDTHISAWDDVFNGKSSLNYRNRIDENRAQFYSECSNMGSCRLRSAKKFIPTEKLWPLGYIWDVHCVGHPFDPIKGRTYAQMEKQMADELFGECTSVQDFVKKSMLAQAEIIGAEVDYARANPDCYGFMNWMYNDNWGCGTWSVVDKYMEQKPVYYYQKRSYQSIVVRYVFQRGKWGLVVVNDSTKPYEGELSYGVKNLDGTVIRQKTTTVKVGTGEVLWVEELSACDKGDYRYARLADGIDSTIFYLKPFTSYDWQSDVETELLGEDAAGIKIRVKANAFARCVFLDYPTPVSCSDNYFDMEKGEEKIVCLYGLKKENYSDVRVKTFAEEWTE